MSGFALRHDPRPGDAELLAAIAAACGNFAPAEIAFVPEILAQLAEQGAEASGYRLLVAEDPDGPAGFAIYGPIPATDGSYDLYWIATHPRARGRGAGRLLLAEAARRAAAEGAARLFIETETGADYAAAHRLYESCGFPLIATVPDYYRSGSGKAIYGGPLKRG
ncbi:MAG: GNAT family N-acetyltransferase [Alphaproteobacteria bacterium]|nr:GNAT family N-acetyltransferase [Alphaproteobacteria bacterium]